jgi:hypothetical protein
MDARGMTTRDIQGHVEEIYGVEVSPTLLSHVTDAVEEEVRAWQSRPLDVSEVATNTPSRTIRVTLSSDPKCCRATARPLSGAR